MLLHSREKAKNVDWKIHVDWKTQICRECQYISTNKVGVLIIDLEIYSSVLLFIIIILF